MRENKQDKYSNPFRATLTGIQALFKKPVPAGILSPGDRLDGKTVLVDGASSGLDLPLPRMPPGGAPVSSWPAGAEYLKKANK